MPTFDVWDIIKVPFPYTDRPVRERRPALVAVADGIQERHGLLWVLMVTSSENRGWPGDVDISDLETAGLRAASIIRTAKVATIEVKEAERIGVLSVGDRSAVRGDLRRTLAEVVKVPRRR